MAAAASSALVAVQHQHAPSLVYDPTRSSGSAAATMHAPSPSAVVAAASPYAQAHPSYVHATASTSTSGAALAASPGVAARLDSGSSARPDAHGDQHNTSMLAAPHHPHHRHPAIVTSGSSSTSPSLAPPAAMMAMRASPPGGPAALSPSSASPVSALSGSSSASASQPSLPSPASSPTTTTSHPTEAAAVSRSPDGQHTFSFVRPGDIVYSSGPPPAPPLPAIGTRSYTVLKEVGDGSFGTVWLADWHSPLALPKGTGPPGPSSRPEYKGKRLVALKRMKKVFEGGWDECINLKELKSLRSIPMHPNIIPLYDAFLLPSSKELYFVFECMEGNLYQLTKSRKGRPLAAGLVANLLCQILEGLHHIHASGYFHRDMKPENLLITTTGLADYPAYIPPHLAHDARYQNRPPEKDVVAIVKIADFGLARETKSKPPYTEYVSTRWYRAPEVLLRSRDYSNPVDMWAVGTILSEMVTLKPLFPGQSEVDQVYRICEILGNPSDEYDVVSATPSGQRFRSGGGNWERGIKMAKQVGFSYPKIVPIDFLSLFDVNQVPVELVSIIRDLIKYDPKNRMTTSQCLSHDYFTRVAVHLRPTPIPSLPNHVTRTQQHQQQPNGSAGSATSPPIPKGPLTPSVERLSLHSHPGGGGSLPSPRDMPTSHSYRSQLAKPAFDPTNGSSMSLPPPLPNGLSNQQQGAGIGQHSSAPAPPSSTSTGRSAYSTSDYYASAAQSSQRDPRQHPAGLQQRTSYASSDASGLSGIQVRLGDSTTSSTSPNAMRYPESVTDVSSMDMDHNVALDGKQQQQRQPSPAPSSVYSFGQGPSDVLPPPNVPPHHPYASQHPHHHPLRQGPNGYASSIHSGSFYNPSIYSGTSGRRGSAGGASTFYDGSIFEGIAPTRAASILSFPASYGEAPPSPKFAQPAQYAGSNYPASIRSGYSQQQQQQQAAPNSYIQSLRRARQDPDNFSVDFEREALQRSQNAVQATGDSNDGMKQPQPQQQQQGKGSSAASVKEGGGGKRSWMSSVFNSSSSSHSGSNHHQQHQHSHSQHGPVHHPQQQPLVVPPSFSLSNLASSGASIHSSHHSILQSSGTSLKRSPSERSMHNLENQQSASATTAGSAAAPTQASAAPALPLDPKKAKKEAERLAKEAEKAKREAAQRAARDRARAVMQKRNALAQAADPLHNFGQHHLPAGGAAAGSGGATASSATSIASGSTGKTQQQLDREKQQRLLLEAAARKQQALLAQAGKLPQIAENDRLRNGTQYQPGQQLFKARRRDDDDDVHSVSSSETRSERRFSMSSHATGNSVESESGVGPGRAGRNAYPSNFLAPMRRSPSVASFGGQSHLSVGSQSSAYSSSRRDIGTSGSGTSSLEFGLVGRFQGLTAAESESRGASAHGGGSTSPTSPTHSMVDPMNHQTPHMHQFGAAFPSAGMKPGSAASGHHGGGGGSGSSIANHNHSHSGSSSNLFHHQQHNITLPPIHSFDQPPKDFSFAGSPVAPRTSQSQTSNNSTISGHSALPVPQQHHLANGHGGGAGAGLPITQEMYDQHRYHQQQQMQH